MPYFFQSILNVFVYVFVDVNNYLFVLYTL